MKLSIAPRGKKKSVTVVQGLKTFGIDLKVASKFFAQKFASAASVTGDDEIVIQGDCKDDLFDLIPEKWPEVGYLMGGGGSSSKNVGSKRYSRNRL